MGNANPRAKPATHRAALIPDMQKTPNPNRLYEIDLLRFVAALSVVLYHYAFRGHAADNMTVMPYPSIAPVAKYGYLGVDMFFMISGFVIFMTVSAGSARRFVISRVVRLYPAFWVCCTVTFIVSLIAGGAVYPVSWYQYAINMTMLGGLTKVEYIDSVYWSLFLEMKFYALVFILLILRKMDAAKNLLGLWLIIVIALSQWKIRYIGFVFIPEYAHYFIAGAMFYLVHKQGVCFYKMFIIIVSYVVAIKAALEKALSMGVHYHTQFETITIIIAISVFYIIFLLMSTGFTKNFSSERWLLLGALTYPLYLIHQNIGYMIFNLAYPLINPHVIMLGTITTMLLAAYIIDVKIERPYSRAIKLALEWLLGASNNRANRPPSPEQADKDINSDEKENAHTHQTFDKG